MARVRLEHYTLITPNVSAFRESREEQKCTLPTSESPEKRRRTLVCFIPLFAPNTSHQLSYYHPS